MSVNIRFLIIQVLKSGNARKIENSQRNQEKVMEFKNEKFVATLL